MPRHNFAPPRGRLETVVIDSDAVRGNLLGDPAERTVSVYLPEGYDEATTDYPLLVGLAGFTSSGLKLLAWQTFGENLPQRIDRLVADNRMGQAIVAFPGANVRDVRYEQSLFDRILGIAHIEIFTADVTTPQLNIPGLPASRQLFEKIRDSIEIQRQARNVVGFVQ